MIRNLLIFCTIGITIIFIPTFSLAQEMRPFSFNVKLGGYSPTGDLNDTKDIFGENYKDGPSLEISFQHKIIQYFGIEYSLGLFNTKLEEAEKDSLTYDSDMTNVYFLATAQGFYQIKRFEIYGGAGMGYYRVNAHLEVRQPSGYQEEFDDDDNVFGMHILAGVKLNITKTFYLGVEGRNIWTQDAKISIEQDGKKYTEEFDVNGYTLSGIIGFRFD